MALVLSIIIDPNNLMFGRQIIFLSALWFSKIDCEEIATSTTESTISSNCKNVTCKFSAPPVEAMSRLLPSTDSINNNNDSKTSYSSNIDLITSAPSVDLSAYSNFKANKDNKSGFAPSPFLGIISEIKTYPQGVSVGEILPDTVGGEHFSRPKQAYVGTQRPIVLQSDIKVAATEKTSAKEELQEKKSTEIKSEDYLSLGDYSVTPKDIGDQETRTQNLVLQNLQNQLLQKQGEYRPSDFNYERHHELRRKPNLFAHHLEINPTIKSEITFPTKDYQDYRPKVSEQYEIRDKPDVFIDGFDHTQQLLKSNGYKQAAEMLFKSQTNYKGEGYQYERPLGLHLDTNILQDYQQAMFQIPGSIKPVKEETYDDAKYPAFPPATKIYPQQSLTDGSQIPYNKQVQLYNEDYKHGHHFDDDYKYVHHHDDGSGKLKSVFRFLATVIPIGLLVAALSPSLLVVNSTDNTTEASKIKYRSLDGLSPEIQGSILEAEALDSCQKRKLCEAVVRTGSAKFQPYIQQIAKK
ncbi:hypothetical protein O3M35_000258 [Rhynocoris fuscipes]|uniref:Uncharacterized protein n=1 Tax=Rhynocoris fuscipes TaxID=488301 RepID=A0AAW1DLH3_9HEMI